MDTPNSSSFNDESQAANNKTDTKKIPLSDPIEQSPLEQRSGDFKTPAETSPESNVGNASNVQSEPDAVIPPTSPGLNETPSSPARDVNQAPPQTEDTDLFLQSILNDKKTEPPKTDTTPGGYNPPEQAQQEVPINSQNVSSATNVDLAGPATNVPENQQGTANVASEQTQGPINPAAPTDLTGAQPQQSTGPTMQDIVPADKNAKTNAKDNIFAGNQPPKGGSSLKIIGAIIIGLIIIGIVFYLYSAFFSGKSATVSPQNAALTSPAASQSSSGLNTNDTKRKEDITKIQSALEKYKTATGSYPQASNIIFLSDPGNVLSVALIPDYLSALPSDPDPLRKYGYKSDGSTYELTAVFDSADDPNVKVEGNLNVYTLTPSSPSSDTTVQATDTSTASDSNAINYNNGSLPQE